MPNKLHQIDSNEWPIIDIMVCPLIGDTNNFEPSRCIKIKALIDTWASCSCVDDSIAVSLWLQVIDICNVLTPSGSAMQNVYTSAISLENMGVIQVQKWSLYGSDFQWQNIKALIWRDILQHFTLIYNGWAWSFQLHI
jgi:hypothetical protein